MRTRTSVMARKDGSSAEKTDYHEDDFIFGFTIAEILRCLDNDSIFYKDGNLPAALARIKAHYLEVMSDDWDFYAKEVLPKFIIKKRGE